MNVIHILEGWAKVALDEFNLLSDENKKISEGRLAHCDSCTIRDHNTCSTARSGINVKTLEVNFGCGCNIAAKTLVNDDECPLGKW